jgi:hypothetical protein
MFRLLHSTATLVRMCPTFNLSCEENSVQHDGNGTGCWTVQALEGRSLL